MTIGKKARPKIAPEKAPPTCNVQLIVPTNELETQPASGMMKKMVSRPMDKRLSIGVKMISMASGMSRCRRFSTTANNQTAKMTPMMPP